MKIDDINKYLLTEISVKINNQLLFVDLRSYKLNRVFISTEVSVSFVLTNKKPEKKDIELLKIATSKNNVVSKSLKRGEEVSGESIFLYTFSDKKNIEQNKNEFMEFIHASYISEKEDMEENNHYWDILINTP